MKESLFGSQFKFDERLTLVNYIWLPSSVCFVAEGEQTGWEGNKGVEFAQQLRTHTWKAGISQCLPSWLKHHLIHPISLSGYIKELNTNEFSWENKQTNHISDTTL